MVTLRNRSRLRTTRCDRTFQNEPDGPGYPHRAAARSGRGLCGLLARVRQLNLWLNSCPFQWTLSAKGEIEMFYGNLKSRLSRAIGTLSMAGILSWRGAAVAFTVSLPQPAHADRCHTATRARQHSGASGEQGVPRGSRRRHPELHLPALRRWLRASYSSRRRPPCSSDDDEATHHPLLQPQPVS